MDDAAFSDWVRGEHIRSDAYAIGEPRDEAYVAERRILGWSVYYSERGLRRDTQRFRTKSDALDELARRLDADPLARSRP